MIYLSSAHERTQNVAAHTPPLCHHSIYVSGGEGENLLAHELWMRITVREKVVETTDKLIIVHKTVLWVLAAGKSLLIRRRERESEWGKESFSRLIRFIGITKKIQNSLSFNSALFACRMNELFRRRIEVICETLQQ